jgi:SNF2 family DNA or RNA helicase
MQSLESVLKKHPFPFTLDPMQIEDINKIAKMRRALGDLPIGYGKTCISTAVSLMLEPAHTVILVPPILIVQWVKWLNSIPGIGKVIAYEGSPQARHNLDIRSARWLVMSYGIFKNDYKRLSKELDDVMTITDEAQVAKSHKSQIFKHIRDFSLGKPLLLMSGTIMSKPADGYAYVKLNSPEVYRTFAMFENIHVKERNFFNQPTEWMNLEMLQANLDLRRVKRTKEEVHSALPKVNYIPLRYELAKPHMALYKKLMNEQLLQLGVEKIDATTAQRLYHYAQQMVANYGYFADDESLRANVFDLIDTVCDEIGLGQPVMPGDLPGSKLILWTNYKITSARVLAYMNDKGLKSVAAYSGADSKASVKQFLEDPDTLCLVAQPGSAGAGLNPQHLCWECLFIETPTTTIPFFQSAGRIDRKGQLYNPNIRIAVAHNTIQEALLDNLFKNDSLVQRASGAKESIKDLIFPK